MNPIYQFRLSVNGGTSQIVYPVWSGLEKEWKKESGYEFFRASLTGRLIFQNADYLTIRNSTLEDLFELEIRVSYDNSSTWNNYWNGYFYKTDCEIDENNRTVSVQPNVRDEYDAILNALDKEIDLIPAAPQLAEVKYHKRPIVQIYTVGQAVIGNYLDGMYWEQSCEVVTDSAEGLQRLNECIFGKLATRETIKATGAIEDFFFGVASPQPTYNSELYSFSYYYAGLDTWTAYITRLSDNVVVYEGSAEGSSAWVVTTLEAVEGSGASGTVNLEWSGIAVYGRLICDVTEYAGTSTMALPDNDITDTTYHYALALGTSYSSIIRFVHQFSQTPTQWGIFQPYQYYVRVNADDVPMARNAWGELSVWLYPYNLNVASPGMFEEGAKEIINTNCYPIESVLQVMFNKLGLSLTFEATSAYSQFFYGSTDIGGGAYIKNVDYRLFITPKSNILKGQYDQPAQKAIVTLREIFNMFQNCFKCYWFIDNGKLRIEHIWYFMHGGSYSGSQTIGRDLTTELMVRNAKPLCYAQASYSYDKPDTVGQLQFSWMDDVTVPFKGEPITILSPYVEQESVEDIQVSKFTSDVDYMQVAPAECSKEGFALLATTKEDETENIQIVSYTTLVEPLKAGDIITSLGTEYSINLYPTTDTSNYITVRTNMLPYVVPERIVMMFALSTIITVTRVGTPEVPFVAFNNDNKLQNGYLSFWYLQRYFEWDLPASSYKIGSGSTQLANGMKRLKTQTVSFVALNDLDTKKLIKTSIGEGQIEKININLSDRNARVTLKFDETPSNDDSE